MEFSVSFGSGAGLVTFGALGLAVGAPNLHAPGHSSKDFFFAPKKTTAPDQLRRRRDNKAYV
jgi:hypothetical protein